MKISQREARRLKKRVAELEEQAASLCNHWSRPYSGTALETWTLNKDVWYGQLIGARKLGKVLVARADDSGRVTFYAL